MFLDVSQLTSYVSRDIDLSEKDDITVLKLELSNGSSFLCVILVGCRFNIICYIIFKATP